MIGVCLLDQMILWKGKWWDYVLPIRLIILLNWKLTGFEGNIFVTDIALKRFSLQLILCNPSIVFTSLSITVESAPDSKREFTVTVQLSFEILTAITCQRAF